MGTLDVIVCKSKNWHRVFRVVLELDAGRWTCASRDRVRVGRGGTVDHARVGIEACCADQVGEDPAVCGGARSSRAQGYGEREGVCEYGDGAEGGDYDEDNGACVGAVQEGD